MCVGHRSIRIKRDCYRERQKIISFFGPAGVWGEWWEEGAAKLYLTKMRMFVFLNIKAFTLWFSLWSFFELHVFIISFCYLYVRFYFKKKNCNREDRKKRTFEGNSLSCGFLGIIVAQTLVSTLAIFQCLLKHSASFHYLSLRSGTRSTFYKNANTPGSLKGCHHQSPISRPQNSVRQVDSDSFTLWVKLSFLSWAGI